MSEELKKTTLLPRFGNRMPYNTVVMDKPPEMTVEFSRAEGKVTHNLRVQPPVPPMPDPARTMPPPMPDSKGPKATHIVPIEAGPRSVEQRAGKQTSIGALRTRMMNAKAMPTFHNPVGADAHRPPPPPPPPTLHVTPLAQCGGRKHNLRKVLFVGGAAMVLRSRQRPRRSRQRKRPPSKRLHPSRRRKRLHPLLLHPLLLHPLLLHPLLLQPPLLHPLLQHPSRRRKRLHPRHR